MKKLFLLVLMFPWLIAAQSTSIYGTWLSYENQEVLQMDFDGTFQRSIGDEVVTGSYILYDNVIHVINDDGRSYNLHYYISGVALYVEKPSSNKAWIFTKINN